MRAEMGSGDSRRWRSERKLGSEPTVVSGSRRIVAAVLAIAVSIGTLTWAFHDVDVEALRRQLGRTALLPLLAYAAAQLLGHAVRVVRWGLLVRPISDVSTRSIFAAASVGLPATFFLPFRLGELVRPAMLKRAGASFGGTFASVVVERVADGLVNVGLFFVLLGLLPTQVAPEVRRFSWIALGLFATALVGLAIGYAYRDSFLRSIRHMTQWLGESASERIVGLVRTFLSGLEALRSPSRVVSFVALSLLFWAIIGGSTQILAASYINGLPILAGPFAVTVVVFAIMIPAGPAFAGTMEAGFRLGMAPFGIDPSDVIVVAVVAHATQLVTMALIAGAGFWAASAGERDAASHAGDPEALPD